MFYDAITNDHGLKHDPFKALVTPRPIGWISSISEDGILNLAPYSFFNAVSSNPNYVMFSSLGRKDSQRNIEATKEFVCCMATYELRDAMNKTSAHVGPEVDEFGLAGLTAEPSKLVKPARVKESPIALECRYYQTIELPHNEGQQEGYCMIFGQVVGVHIDDSVIENGMVVTSRFTPLARLGYMEYTAVENIFSINRP